MRDEQTGVADARRMEKRQKVLADFGEFALRSDDLDDVLTQACRLVAEALGTGRAKILEIEHESRTLFVRAGVGWDEGVVGRLRLPMSDHSSETYSIEAGEPVITNDLASEQRFDFPAFLKEAGVKAIANVPVFLPGGKPFGLLQVDASAPRAFDGDDSQFLRTYAMILGPVIDRLLKVHALGATEQRFRTLFESMDEGYLLGEVLFSEHGEAVDIRFLEANPAAVRLAGRDFVGQRMREIDPHYEDFWYKTYGRVALTGESIRAEHYAEPHGRWFDFQLSKVGPPERRLVASVFQDVTERKSAEQASRESEERQAFLLKLSDALRATPDDAIIERALGMLAEQLRLDLCYVITVFPDEDRADVVHQLRRHTNMPRVPATIRLSDYPLAVVQWQERTLVSEDMANDPALTEVDRQNVAAMGFGALVAAPVRRGAGNPIWSIVAVMAQARRWTASEIALVEETTERTWAAVERARAEAALRGGEEKYRALFDSIDEGFAIVEMIYDDRGDIVDMIFRTVNPAYERQGGVVDVVGRSIREVVPGIEEVWLDRYRQVAKTGQALRVEDYQHELGRWFDVYFSRADADGRFVAIVFNDISERKRAELALRASEQRYQALLAGSPVPSIIVAPNAPDYTILDVNDVYVAATLSTREALIGRKLFDVFVYDPSHPGLQGTGEVARSFERVLATRQTDIMPRVRQDMMTSDGELEPHWWLGINAPMLDPDGNVIAIIHQATRVTEQYYAEEAAREGEERQAFLLKLSDAVRPLADPADIQGETTRLLREQLNAGWCYYVDWDLHRSIGLVLRDSATEGLPSLVGAHDVSDAPELLQLLADGAVRTVRDYANYEQLPARIREKYVGLGFRSMMMAPLVKEGRLIATLLVGHTQVRDWSGSEASLLVEVAERTWAAIERARVEAALAESETLFRTLAEVIEDVFYVTDLDAGRLEYLSSTYEAIWGRPTADLTADLSRFIETIHPDDRAMVEANQARQAKGEAVHSEYRIVRPDGAVRWILDRCFPIPDGGRRLPAGVASDITNRREAEERVRASEERFRLLVESVRDYAIFTMDRDGIVTSWPAGATAVFGWPEAEMLGRSVDATFTPEDIAAGVPPRERETAAREGLAPNVRWHLRNDGSRIFIDGSTQPLVGANGAIREFIKIGQDVTEAKRVQQALTDSEQRLRTLTEGIPQLVWRSADEGQWTWSSPQWQTCTGQSLEESLGLGWLNAIHADDRDAAMRAWQSAAGNGGMDVEYRVRRASDGAYLWHHSRAVPVRDADGRVVEWLGTTTDVQQLKELQERQEVMVAELQHRTRNLIAVVRSIARQTMAQTGPTEAFRDELNHRLEALARVQGLLSRSDEEPITIEALIRMELDALGAKPEAGRIDVDGPAVRIRNTVVQTLALALHELATNARKYGALSSESGRLKVCWRTYSDGKGERLALEWTEVGGQAPKSEADARRGYGRELIEQALPYSLNAKTCFEHNETGLRCTIDMPLERNRSRKKAV